MEMLYRTKTASRKSLSVTRGDLVRLARESAGDGAVDPVTEGEDSETNEGGFVGANRTGSVLSVLLLPDVF